MVVSIVVVMGVPVLIVIVAHRRLSRRWILAVAFILLWRVTVPRRRAISGIKPRRKAVSGMR
jgi:hypothetical protein